MAEEIRGVIVNREVTKRGPNDSDPINAFMQEVRQEIALLRESFNTWTRPILHGLPSRSNDPTYEITTDPTDPTDIDAVVHGLDGSQIFTDNEAAAATIDPRTGNNYNEVFYTGDRPRTVKETIDAVNEILDELYTSINGVADTVNRYVSSSDEQATQLTQIQSMMSSGNLQTILNNVQQVARDVYDIGEAALTGDGTAQLATTLQSRLDSMETSIETVSDTINVSKLSDEHIKTNAGIASSKISITTPTEYTGLMTTMQKALDRMATVISVLAHGAGNFANWDQLPTGPTNITPQSLSDHINYVGAGGTAGASVTNSHAIGLADVLEFDTVALLTAAGLDGDLSQTIIRADIDELLGCVPHYITYERDTYNRVSIERHYESDTSPLLYRKVYTYDGATDTVTQVVKTDYRRSLRIPGEPPVVATTAYTYDSEGRVTSVNTTV